jgi:hypothetical protein
VEADVGAETRRIFARRDFGITKSRGSSWRAVADGFATGGERETWNGHPRKQVKR